MWRLTLLFEDGTEVYRTYQTYRGAKQAARYYFRHRSDLKEWQVAAIMA